MMLSRISTRLARPAARVASQTPQRARIVTRAAAQQREPRDASLSVPAGYGVSRRPLANDLFFPAQVGSIFRDIEQELNRVWGGEGAGGGATNTALGQVDIKETKEAFLFKMDCPGLSKKDVSVRITPDNVLVISGERSREKHAEEDGLHRTERVYGKFSRSFQLPEKMVDVKGVTAKVMHGELTLTVPKRQPEPEPEAQEIPVE